MDELSSLSFRDLCEFFLDTERVISFLGADSDDIGEISYGLDEFAFEISKRPKGLEYIKTHIHEWDSRRQASCLSVLKNSDWLAEFAKEKLASDDEMLRAFALRTVYENARCALVKLLEKAMDDSSALVRGVAAEGLVRIYSPQKEKLLSLKKKVEKDSELVQEWYEDAIDDQSGQ